MISTPKRRVLKLNGNRFINSENTAIMTTALTLANTRAAGNSLAVRDPWALVARGPLGNLDAYISATHQIPMLSPEEEVEARRTPAARQRP